MGTVNVTLGDGKKLNLILGQQLENAVTAVVFDFSAWQTEFGSGTLGLSVQRHGDTQPYAVVPTVSGTNATWNISELDTAYKGVGEVQVTYTVGSVVKKSTVYKFTVYRSLGENGEYPSPGQTWQEEIEDDITDIKQDLANIYVQDGKLYIDGVAYELGGVGISNIAKTGTDGLVDTYTITMTDGTTYTFTVTNGDASDAKIQGFIDDWLDEHPEATTTVQDGAVTMAKLAPDVVSKFNDINLTYKWNAQGYMRYHVRDFQGWAQNVVFDPDLNCAVGIINSGNGSHTNAQPWYRVTIDNSGYMSPYQEIKVYDTDGTTQITPTKGYMGTVQRLSDGTYMCIDINATIYTSTDKLVSLKKERDYNFTSGTDKSMFSLTELSNGRLIIGHGGQVNGFWYSDNDGVSWTNVVPNASGLGNQAYPEGAYTPFEPCFIEVGDGKIIAYARKSMNACVSSPSNAYGRQEPTVYSVSTDYGNTWSAWQNSSVITDMTACNGKVVIIDGVVHFVYGSRYDNTDADFKLFYTYAKLEDAYEDNWATPIVIDVGQWNPSTATNPHDSGYPSLWKDKNNNLYSVHYDSDGSGSPYGANWRLCTGAPIEKKPAVYNGGSGSYNVAYTQKAVDDKLANLITQINALWLAIGELPDDPTDYDGTSPIYSDLVAWFDVTDTTKWDNYTATSLVGDVTAIGRGSHNAGVGSAQAPTAFNNGMANIGQLHVQKALSELVGANATAFTIEFIAYYTRNDTVILLRSGAGTSGTNVYQKYGTKIGSSYMSDAPRTPHHLVMIFTDGSIAWYRDGVYAQTEATSVTFANILASYPLPNAHNNAEGACVGDMRIYSRALTADEIRNNYLYTKHETDYSTAPVFTTT